MESKVEEVYEMVRQMQATNKTVLQRLESTVPCECSYKLKDAQAEINALTSRIESLENRDAEKDSLLLKLADQMKEMQVKIETLTLTLQTDDSKLKRTKVVEGISRSSTVRDTVRAQSSGDILAPVADSSNRIKSEHAGSVSSVDDDAYDRSAHAASGRDGREEIVPDKDRGVTRQVKFAQPDRITTLSEDQTSQAVEVKTRSVHRTNHGTIEKPNFGAKLKSHTLEVELVKQMETKSHFSTLNWEIPAQLELKSARESELGTLGGVHDVIVIDTSASMASAWPQVKDFVNDFLNGLEGMTRDFGLDKEHVAIVTFGLETKVQQRLTNDFNKLRTAFKSLKVGGPSPVNAGLLFALAAAGSSCMSAVVNNKHQGTRFILITDGEATDPFTYEGPDVPNPIREEETKQHILINTEKIQAVNGELCCVPVGKVKKDFFDMMESLGNGKIIDCTKGRQLSRKVFLMLQPSDPEMSHGVDFSAFGFQASLTEDDKKDIERIVEEEREFRESVVKCRYTESNTDDLPKLGSRVRRGPDWEYNGQDSQGPGTVVGHCPLVKKVYVTWDVNGYTDVYRYGDSGKYDILLVDETRKLEKGETIAVGCVVQPGPFWKPAEGLSVHSRGIVLNLELGRSNKPQAMVRWENGRRGEYAYDISDEPEIEVCSDGNPFTVEQALATGYQHNPSRNQSIPQKQTRNKNKNKNQI